MPAKRSKKKRRAGSSPTQQQAPRATEPRGVEALTVFWMLTTLATLLAEAAALAVWLWAPAAREGGTATLLSLFPRAMFFTALVTGTLSLSLTLLARRLRCEPPPRSITWTAVAIGASPWLLLAWQSMFPQ